MKVYREQIEVSSHGGTPTYIDITPQVRAAIGRSGVAEGLCAVLTPHTTCSVFFEEYVHDVDEDGNEFLQADLNRVLEKIIPDQTEGTEYRYPGPAHYRAVESWPDAASYLPNGDRRALFNGDAHLKATLLGASELFSVEDGALGVGETGYIYFADFDRTRPRTRKCKIVVLGEST